MNSPAAASWDALLSHDDRAVLAASGLGRRQGLGTRPALLVVDVTHAFIGDRPEPILESIRRFPLSCGARGWDSLPRLAALIATARENGAPVVYTKQASRASAVLTGTWSAKNARLHDMSAELGAIAERIPDVIAPVDGDVVIAKDKPSAFFGTSLVSLLNAMGVDSLIIAGTSTSGCVRATVVDAFSYNYPIVVVGDCTFDRFNLSHQAALFDIDGKYADVIDSAEAADLLRQYRATTSGVMT